GPLRPATPSLFTLHDAATHRPHTLSLHDALPIYPTATAVPELDAPPRDLFEHGVDERRLDRDPVRGLDEPVVGVERPHDRRAGRSEEHTSELQSLAYLVCRLLLEKKKRWTNWRPA